MSQIYTAIWNEVENAEIGLYIGCDTLENMGTLKSELSRFKPTHLADCQISVVPDAIFILRPGVDLDAALS